MCGRTVVVGVQLKYERLMNDSYCEHHGYQ